MWLEVNKTTNDPKVAASLSMLSVKEPRGCPRVIGLRADRRTENVHVAHMQTDVSGDHGDALVQLIAIWQNAAQPISGWSAGGVCCED